MAIEAKKATAAGRVDGLAVSGIIIPKAKIEMITVRIVGTSSLIVHAWSEKAKKQMRDSQTKKAKGTREAKNPQEEYQSSIYVADEGWYGVPSAGFKAAFVGACRLVPDLSMTMARRIMFVRADGRSTKQSNVELTRVYGEPKMREDFVRLDSGVADIRYRGEFLEWSSAITVEFNAAAVSEEQIVNLIELAGYSEGVCEWRPSSPKSDTGTHGKWTVCRGQ